MKHYVTGFNGLRTIGVLTVILYHLWPNHVQGGFLGVVLFFVLSGYLVTDSLLREYERSKKINIWKFWGRRIKRLYPLLISIFLLVTPYIIIFQPNLWAGLRSNFLSAVFSVQNWWQISQGSSYFADIAGASPFKHIYYLAIEGQFFIIWPLLLIVLLKFVKKRGRIFIIANVLAILSAILMAVLFVPGADPTRVYYGTDTRFFSLMMGASLAFIWPLNKLSHKVNKKATKIAWQLIIGLSLVLLVAYIFMPAQGTFAYYGGMWLASLASVILVALVAHPSLPANKLFSNPVFEYIGSRSYGIYLWQLPVFAFAEAKVLAPTSWYNLIWQLSLILILTELSYRLIELPTQRFDYSNVFEIVQNFIREKGWKLKKNIGPMILSGLILISLGFIIFSPPSPHDQRLIEEKIMAQQVALQKKQLAEANNKVPLSLKTVAEKYEIQPVVAEKASQMNVLALGDSVMVAASTNLQEVFPHMYIDAAVGRQAESLATDLTNAKAKMPNPDAYLIGLGTNGTIKESEIEAAMKVAGNKPVYWMNIHADRVWAKPNNNLLTKTAKKYKNLKIIDWNKKASGHNAWFYSDNIHPKGTGAEEYATLVANSLIKVAK